MIVKPAEPCVQLVEAGVDPYLGLISLPGSGEVALARGAGDEVEVVAAMVIVRKANALQHHEHRNDRPETCRGVTSP